MNGFKSFLNDTCINETVPCCLNVFASGAAKGGPGWTSGWACAHPTF